MLPCISFNIFCLKGFERLCAGSVDTGITDKRAEESEVTTKHDVVVIATSC